MPKSLIVANWKMNPKTGEEAQELFQTVAEGVSEVDGAEVVICPPFIYLGQLSPYGGSPEGRKTKNYPSTKLRAGKLQTGAQNCFWEGGGAFTGEVSASMLKNLGCSHVILGHSERKNYLGETFEMVNKKIKAALAADLIPVVCIGEEIEKEVGALFHNIEHWKLKIENLVLVYEPEWAISTAKNAKADSPEHVKDAIGRIKTIAGSDIPVLYGGSTNSKNIRDFIENGAQGALVGSASLDEKEFVQLVRNAAMV